MNIRPLAAIVRVVIVLGLATSLSQQAGAGVQSKSVTIKEHDQKITIDCNGTTVTISGNDNKLNLKGECKKLTVKGNDNTISATKVTEIAVSGDDNKITVETVAKITTPGGDNNIVWTKGVGGKIPLISNKGSDNIIKQKDARP